MSILDRTDKRLYHLRLNEVANELIQLVEPERGPITLVIVIRGPLRTRRSENPLFWIHD